jgi:hypothetical protein
VQGRVLSEDLSLCALKATTQCAAAPELSVLWDNLMPIGPLVAGKPFIVIGLEFRRSMQREHVFEVSVPEFCLLTHQAEVVFVARCVVEIGRLVTHLTTPEPTCVSGQRPVTRPLSICYHDGESGKVDAPT